MIKLTLLLILSFNLHATCSSIAGMFNKKGEPVILYHHPQEARHEGTIEAIIDNRSVGYIVYDHKDNLTHIASVIVKEKHRRKGIQTLLVEQLIKETNPDVVEFSIGHTNKDVFLNNIKYYTEDELMDHAQGGLEIYYKRVIHAAISTPTGRTLFNLGYDNIDVDLKVFSRFLHISLEFKR